MDNSLSVHIVSFSIPLPANFGGVIDVFYKLKTLHSAGVKIYLHCFQYDRQPDHELEKYCVSVKYYRRNTGFASTLRLRPYIVQSRISPELVEDLLQDDYPIIFEGLHCCYYLDDERLRNRLKIYRESNIEHEYYYHLFKSTNNIRKKTFYLLESLKLRLYQKQIRHADCIIAVSKSDTEYLQRKFPGNKVIYLPSFHGNNEVVSKEGRGDYILYHGNLSVEENVLAALYLIDCLGGLDIPFVIAGLNPDSLIVNAARKYSNIVIIDSPDDEKMHQLISDAQINILYTAQATGLKLKLLNVLYRGRHVLVNSKMVSGTGLGEICEIADTKEEMKAKIMQLFNTDFDRSKIEKRTAILSDLYDDVRNGEKLCEIIGN